MSKALPSLLGSTYYSGNSQPFTIYNKGFKVGNNLDFEGNIAVTQATMERLNEVGSGGVFLMIPSSVANTFIPTPVFTPVLNEETTKMLSQVISARALGANQVLLDKVTKNYGINIGTSSRNLKEFLENYIYFTTEEDVQKTEGTGKVKWHFDTKTSTITVNLSNGSKPISIALNAAQKNPTEFAEKMTRLEEALGKTKQSIKLSKINSTDPFYKAVLDQDGNVDFLQTTYNQFLSENILTDLIELESANGVPVYTTQPVIAIEQIVSKPAENNAEIKENFAEINLDDFAIDNFHLNNLDDVIPTEEDLSIGVNSLNISNKAKQQLITYKKYIKLENWISNQIKLLKEDRDHNIKRISEAFRGDTTHIKYIPEDIKLLAKEFFSSTFDRETGETLYTKFEDWQNKEKNLKAYPRTGTILDFFDSDFVYNPFNEENEVVANELESV
jgi:hypothetical protein